MLHCTVNYIYTPTPLRKMQGLSTEMGKLQYKLNFFTKMQVKMTITSQYYVFMANNKMKCNDEENKEVTCFYES